MLILITIFCCCHCVGGEIVAIFAVNYSFVRRHTLHIGVSIGVPSRRVPGAVVLLSVLYGIVLMAVGQKSVKFADIVVMQFQFQRNETVYNNTSITGCCLWPPRSTPIIY
jgi:hypothetical protein